VQLTGAGAGAGAEAGAGACAEAGAGAAATGLGAGAGAAVAVAAAAAGDALATVLEAGVVSPPPPPQAASHKVVNAADANLRLPVLLNPRCIASLHPANRHGQAHRGARQHSLTADGREAHRRTTLLLRLAASGVG
jgi:hypothetical protein